MKKDFISLVKLISNSMILVLFILSIDVIAKRSPKILNLCIDPNWMPFEGLIDGKHTGIAKDYLNLFTQFTPYEFSIKETTSWKESTELLKTGKCDLTLLLNRSVEREKYLSFTMPYFFGPNVLVSKKEIPFMQDLSSIGNMKLGVVSGYRLLEEIPQYNPNINIKVVASEDAGLLAVEDGLIDVYVGSLFSVNLRINQLKLGDLKINGWITLQDQLRIGFTKSNADLVPIFNQAIDKISSKQHNEILNRWSNVQIIKQTDYTLLYYFGLVASFILVVFSWRYFVSVKIFSALKFKNKELEQTRKELINANKNLEYLSFHDNLTNLHNRHFFMSTLKHHFSNLSRQKGISAILMIDLDFFKKINDQYGHAVGDKVLKEFSEILLSNLRAGDVAARWGGEEFIVLLPTADRVRTLTIAKRLIKDVEQFSFNRDIKLTISVGVSQYNLNDDIESWVERADKGLYQAKNQGRNCVKEFA